MQAVCYNHVAGGCLYQRPLPAKKLLKKASPLYLLIDGSVPLVAGAAAAGNTFVAHFLLIIKGAWWSVSRRAELGECKRARAHIWSRRFFYEVVTEGRYALSPHYM